MEYTVRPQEEKECSISMLLYRLAKMMEEQTRNRTLSVVPEQLGASDSGFAELLQIRAQMGMAEEVPVWLEEDCSDWGAEATY